MGRASAGAFHIPADGSAREKRRGPLPLYLACNCLSSSPAPCVFVISPRRARPQQDKQRNRMSKKGKAH